MVGDSCCWNIPSVYSPYFTIARKLLLADFNMRTGLPQKTLVSLSCTRRHSQWEGLHN